MCLPTCPTYDATLMERSSPRGRIAMMRAVAEGRLEVGETFADEMYFCLGCLACQTACPAGVDYGQLIETARAEVERSGVLAAPGRSAVRGFMLRWLFTSRRQLHALGRLLRIYQRWGLERAVRGLGLLRLAPRRLRELEPLTPRVSTRFTHELFASRYEARNPQAPSLRVGLVSGCVQDLAYAEVNADTIEVLQTNGCEVVLPPGQQCCGSLHGHNGEVDSARRLARANLDAFDLDGLDAVVVNAGGCGSHVKHYDRLLTGDGAYRTRAAEWSRKVRDVHELLVDIGPRPPRGCLRGADGGCLRVTYHESCHLAHGQGVSQAPRQVLAAIPGLELVELAESDWCCGSAGIYNITQPEMSAALLERKLKHLGATGAEVVATGNPGCVVQIEVGLRRRGETVRVEHPVSLLAAAYRAEEEEG